MHCIAGFLAALLSLLMVSAPIATSNCELSCWLRATHSGCHAVGNQETPTSMSSMEQQQAGMASMGMGGGMKMRTESESGKLSDRFAKDGRFVHSMYSQP